LYQTDVCRHDVTPSGNPGSVFGPSAIKLSLCLPTSSVKRVRNNLITWNDPKDSAEIDRRIREGFVPIVKKAKGFVRYYWLDTGKGEGASVSVFKDKAGADESVRLAADYVQTHLSKLRIQKPEIIEGPIKAHD